MNERFKFRFWCYNGVEQKMVCRYFDFVATDGSAIPYNDSEGGAYPDYDHTYICEQCTGLKDKNGKLIYEGDILRLTDQCIQYIVSVYWESGMYCFAITPNDANLVFSDLSDNETTVEIVGNIHENKDLFDEA